MLFGFPFFAIKYTCCWNITDYRYFIVVHAHLEWEWSLKWIFLISLYSVDHSCRKEERKDGEDEREREGWRGRRNATPLYYDTHTHIHPYTIRWVLSTIWLMCCVYTIYSSIQVYCILDYISLFSQHLMNVHYMSVYILRNTQSHLMLTQSALVCLISAHLSTRSLCLTARNLLRCVCECV